jgi:Uma2 family endonuclease
MPTVEAMSESRVLLHGIRWETYERLLDEVENQGIRLTYDRGDLEIMTPSHRHESWKQRVARMIETMTEALGVAMKSGGQTTFRKRSLRRGLEPDECYWVQNEAAVRGKLDLDLRTDPAPDLVLEAEASRSILDRLDILASLGVGEVWRYDGERLTIHVLGADGHYAVSAQSCVFPWLPVQPFIAHLQRANDTDETTWIRAFRAWVLQSVRTS